MARRLRLTLALLAATTRGFAAAGLLGSTGGGAAAESVSAETEQAVKDATYEGLATYYSTVTSPSAALRLLAVLHSKPAGPVARGLSRSEVVSAKSSGTAAINRWLTGPAKALQLKTMSQTLSMGLPGTMTPGDGAGTDGNGPIVSSVVVLDGGIVKPMAFTSVDITGATAKVTASAGAWETTLVYYDDGTSQQVKSSNTDIYAVSLIRNEDGDWQVSDYTVDHQ